MKRFILALLFSSVSLFAVGSVQQTTTQLGTTNTWVTAFTWTGDASNGTVPTTSAVLTCGCQGYLFTQVETVPGTTNPTAGYAVAILDAGGADILGGAAGSLSATTPQAFAAATSATPLQGTFQLRITGQSVASAKGTVYVFFSKPGTINLATINSGGGAVSSSANWLTIANPPFVDPRRYNWTPQSPGGSIAIGANTITMNPMPAGMTASCINVCSVRLSGGTGTAEADLITAWTATTITFTAANTHTGAFTAGPASQGISEGLIAAGSGAGVYLPAGTYNAYAPINFLTDQIIRGESSRTVILNRLFGGSGNLLNQPSGVYGIQASIDNSVSTTGFALNLDHPNSADDTVVEDFQSYSFNGNLGGHIRVNNTGRAHLNNLTTGDSVTYGILWGPTVASGGVLSNWISSQGQTNAQALVWVNGLIDGNNWNLQGGGASSFGIVIQPGAGQASESTISNVTLDSFHGAGLQAVAGAGTIGGITFSKFRCAIVGVPIILNGVTESNFRGWDIAGTVASGVVQVVGGSNLNFSGFNIVSGNTGVGFNLGLTVDTTGVTINDSVIGYTTAGLPAAGFAFSVIVSGASDRITIGGGQKMAGVPVFLGGSGTHFTIGDAIEGLTDTTGTITVSGGGAAAFPVNPSATFDSATAVSSATGLWAGRKGTFVNVNATPGAWTAGASIGNSCTIAQNKLYNYWFDGTKVWLNGPGC